MNRLSEATELFSGFPRLKPGVWALYQLSELRSQQGGSKSGRAEGRALLEVLALRAVLSIGELCSQYGENRCKLNFFIIKEFNC